MDYQLNMYRNFALVAVVYAELVLVVYAALVNTTIQRTTPM